MQRDQMVDQRVATFQLRSKPEPGMVKKLTFLSNRLIKLNFGPSHRSYFSIRNDSSQAKIGAKTNEISTKHQNHN